MEHRYGVVRAATIASLALALAAPVGVVWAQSSEGHHQHDSRSSSEGQRGAPPQPGAHAPRNAGTPAAQHPGGGAPAAGHFSATPRFHAPPVRPNTGAPPQNFRSAPQPSRAPAGGPPAFHAPQGGSNAAPNFSRNGGGRNGFSRDGESSGHLPPNADAGPARGSRGNGFANSGRDAGAGQGGRGFAPNHERNGGFDADREHGGHDGRLAVRRPEERHYDRDHWREHRHWDGGYWNGRYWPAIHDRANFIWLLPALPVGYVTYSWDGEPYYYYDDTYYTWDPAYNGYVATEPPPVADSGPPPDEEQLEQPEQPDSTSDVGAAQLYAYPTQGQSPEQQAEDRQECQQWAYSQSPSADDGYQRALKACLMGRGYSVD